MEKTNRRIFLKLGSMSIFSLFALLWNKATRQFIHSQQNKQTPIVFDKHKPVQFSEDYIIVKGEGQITVLSSHCSHLGCRIKELRNEKLICPCHGSEYDLTGKVLRGPATKNLEVIPAALSEDGNQLIIG